MTRHLRAGDVIGARLRVLRTLGEGGYGLVYEAQPLEGGPRVAVKVMHDRLGDSDVAVGRFEREVGIVHRLCHPGIVAIHSWGLTEQRLPFIAFELLEGRTLREELDARGALGPWHAGEVARQVLDALAHAHRGGVVHRDIKPANIFLAQGAADVPAVKLLDFGVARHVDGGGPALTATGQMVGTPHYMSPEQVRGLEADRRADIYSVGVVLAEMLSGHKLLQADTDIELLMIHADEAPLRLPPVVQATALARVVARAVGKKPEQRYPDAEAMLADLTAAMAELARSGASSGPSWTLSTARTALVEAPWARSAMASDHVGFRPEAYPAAPPAVAQSPSAMPPPPKARRGIWPWVVAGLATVLMVSVAVGLGVGHALRDSRAAEPTRPPVSFDPPSPPDDEALRRVAEQHGQLRAAIRKRIVAAGYAILDDEQDASNDGHRSTFTFRTRSDDYFSLMVITYPSAETAKLIVANYEGQRRDFVVRRVGASMLLLNGVDGGLGPVTKAILP